MNTSRSIRAEYTIQGEPWFAYDPLYLILYRVIGLADNTDCMRRRGFFTARACLERWIGSAGRCIQMAMLGHKEVRMVNCQM